MTVLTVAQALGGGDRTRANLVPGCACTSPEGLDTHTGPNTSRQLQKEAGVPPAEGMGVRPQHQPSGQPELFPRQLSRS